MANRINNLETITKTVFELTTALAALNTLVQEQTATIDVLRAALAAVMQECGWSEPLNLLRQIEGGSKRSDKSVQQARSILQTILRAKERTQ